MEILMLYILINVFNINNECFSCNKYYEIINIFKLKYDKLIERKSYIKYNSINKYFYIKKGTITVRNLDWKIANDYNIMNKIINKTNIHLLFCNENDVLNHFNIKYDIHNKK